MATLSDISSPAILPESLPYNANNDASRENSESTSLDAGSAGEAGGETATCRWRTERFHDQECGRYFDCPSHTIERISSIDETPEQGESSNLGTENDQPAYDLYGDRDSEGPGSSTVSEEQDSESASASGSPEQELTLYEWMGSATSRPDPTSLAQEAPQEQEAGASATMDQAPDGRSGQAQSAPVDIPQATSSPAPLIGIGILEELEPDEDGRSVQAPSAPIDIPQTTSSSPPLIGILETVEPSQVTRSPFASSPNQFQPRIETNSRTASDFTLPRWQPDAEVTYCPICNTQFSFFVRKHHCRKCGRVVCNACSPHRIIIPHQYIVRPPGSEMPVPPNLVLDSLGVGYVDINGVSGGERVRLCNPCVPDPNTAPPQNSSRSSVTPSPLSPRTSHQRSRSSIGDAYGAASSASRYGAVTPSNRYGVVFASGQTHDPFQAYTPRNRSISIHPAGHAIPGSSSSRSRTGIPAYPSAGRYSSSSNPSTSVPSYPSRYSSLRTNAPASSSRHRVLPPTPQLAEEDECPICHRELPQRSLPHFEALRETHITQCIQIHSTYGSPRRPPASGGTNNSGSDTQEEQPAEMLPPPPPRRTGMYVYHATEKDCVDDAECTICLEEFTVGISMARLECLCRFHQSCISAWFVKHPGRCPVHQHDGFGY